MEVNLCFSAHLSHNMITAYPYMKTTQAHVTDLSRAKVKCTEKEREKKNKLNHFTKEKEGRFNLKIGTHSSFLQMKARKWKILESCLVWKSKVMNNVSVSIIKSVLIRWRSSAPAGWEAHTAALLTNQERDKTPWRPWASHPPCWPLSPVYRSERWQTSQACHLCQWIRRQRASAAARAADLRTVANQGMALLLMKTHRSVQ